MHQKREKSGKSLNGAQKAWKSRKEILYKIWGEKHHIAYGLGKKRKQSSFTGNARKEGGITLIKDRHLRRRQTPTSCTTIYSRPFSTYSTSIPPTPFSWTHSRIHAIASPPRHQPETPDFFWNNRFGQRASHNGNKAWHPMRQFRDISLSVATMGHGSTLNLPHSSTPPLYHLYITPSTTTETPDWTLQLQ